MEREGKGALQPGQEAPSSRSVGGGDAQREAGETLRLLLAQEPQPGQRDRGEGGPGAAEHPHREHRAHVHPALERRKDDELSEEDHSVDEHDAADEQRHDNRGFLLRRERAAPVAHRTLDLMVEVFA